MKVNNFYTSKDWQKYKDLQDLRNTIFDIKIRKLIIKKNIKKYTYDINSELERLEIYLQEYTYQYLQAGGSPDDIE